mgnify:CR=1 FL=1
MIPIRLRAAAAATAKRGRRPRLRPPASSSFSSSPPPPPSSSSAVPAFDRDLKRLQRDGAARSHRRRLEAAAGASVPASDLVDYDYFRTEVAARLVDRLDDIRREGGFPLALDLGSGPGYLHRAICADDALGGDGGGIGGVRKLVQLDSSELMLHRDGGGGGEDGDFAGSARCDTYRLLADEVMSALQIFGDEDIVSKQSWASSVPYTGMDGARAGAAEAGRTYHGSVTSS